MRSFIIIRPVLMGDMPRLKFLKNALCFIIGIWLPWKYVLRYFDMIHSIGPINVCTDLCVYRFVGTKLKNLENMQKIT